ncbi:MAG: protein kinase [Polyangiales bacterium]
MNDRVDKMLANDPLIGRTVLGRFEVLRPLARGGMGVLYLARTLGAKGFVKPVVVKRLSTDTTDEMQKMFVREAQVMAHLSHPNIVQAIDFNREGKQYLLVLEYVEGYSLARWAKFMRSMGREFPLQFAVQIVLDVLEALAYAHGLTASDGSPASVIHRDVTPSNVMVSVDGHVKLLDFGIARLEHERSAEGPEGPTIKGKFGYLAPEVLAGEPPTTNSDVYSAAVMLHELVAGKNEFAADDLSATLVNVVKHHPTRLDVLRRDAPTALADVVEHGLEKVPSLRFATAQAFATALRGSRGADPQRVREAMVAQIRRDFFDPKLVESMAGSDLQTLASAWQSEPAPRASITSEHPSEPAAPEARATLPEVRPKRARPVAETLPAPAPAQGSPAHTQSSEPFISQPEPSSSNVLRGAESSGDKSTGMNIAAWAAVLAAVAALTAAGMVLYRSQSAPAQQGFVIVEANQSAATSSDAQSPANPAPERDAASASTSGESASSAGRAATSANRDEATRLTAQFARHRAELEACAREHRDERAEIEAIRFVLDRSGAVQSAEVQPESAAQSALGACVAGVARRARFAPMESAVTFRLPVALRMR